MKQDSGCIIEHPVRRLFFVFILFSVFDMNLFEGIFDNGMANKSCHKGLIVSRYPGIQVRGIQVSMGLWSLTSMRTKLHQTTPVHTSSRVNPL